MPRLRELTEGEMDADQRTIRDRLISGPRGRVAGPYIAWLRSPKLADVAERYGRFVRYETSLPARLTELAILIVARHWNAQVEWWAHHPLALKAGLDPAVAEAIARRRRPRFQAADEEAVYDLATELIKTRSLCEATYARALACFGERALVELVAVLGNYVAVALTLNAFDIQPPDGSRPLSD